MQSPPRALTAQSRPPARPKVHLIFRYTHDSPFPFPARCTAAYRRARRSPQPLRLPVR
ncbi:protein of unknown function [Ectopseudomonas oleovorans]|nr:protein of unknown function [Pseudomonas oleovorans]